MTTLEQPEAVNKALLGWLNIQIANLVGVSQFPRGAG
jgi:hypothetical protein